MMQKDDTDESTLRVESLEATSRILTSNVAVETLVLPKRLPLSGPSRTIKQVERDHVIDVLEFTSGNKTHAARILGLDRRSLYRRLAWYNEPQCAHCGEMTRRNPTHEYNCIYR